MDRKRMSAIEAAQVSANVSYKDGPSTDEIREILASRVCPDKFRVHINHILTEMPHKMLLAAAIDATGDPAVARENMDRLQALMK
jgi:hypothetical protein